MNIVVTKNNNPQIKSVCDRFMWANQMFLLHLFTVTTLERQRFCALDCMNFIYGSKDRSLCTLVLHITIPKFSQSQVPQNLSDLPLARYLLIRKSKAAEICTVVS